MVNNLLGPDQRLDIQYPKGSVVSILTLLESPVNDPLMANDYRSSQHEPELKVTERCSVPPPH